MMEDFILAQMDMVTDSDLGYNEEIEEIEEEEQDLYEELKLKKIDKKEFDENE